MIKFVDINTGDVYDGDKPYVHWFDDVQSVGLNYSKTFLFVTDEGRTGEVHLDSDCFAIVDDYELQKAATENFNGKDFVDLSKITTKKAYINGTRYTDLGSNVAIFQFTVIAYGKCVGEVRDEFSIIFNGKKHTFTIGADFYDENEALGINLSNLGQDVNNEIQRAIYEKNIYEDNPDYILLNRKYKELLNEYINIIANKGSYKSLINSLNWFEYGDLTKIYEFWRYGQGDNVFLSRQDITQYVNSVTEQLLSSMQKTTYISIACAMQKMKEESIMGKIGYDDGKENDKIVSYLKEPVPELENVALYWTRNEMSLKMVLLGNFFATYFMPIHLDLIHSTIEDVVYTNTIKMLSDPLMWRFDNYDGINKFRLHVEKVYHLTNVETWTNIKTPFGYIHNTKNSLTEEDAKLPILGVDLEEDTTQDQICRLKTYMMQHFKGIGVVIPFNCTLYNVFGTNVITDGEIRIYKNGVELDDYRRETQAINNEADPNNPGEIHINFNILLREIGKYKVQIIFRRSDGVRYIKVVDFEVDEENHQTIEMYKLVAKSSADCDLNMPNIWMNGKDDKDTKNTSLSDLAKWVLNPVKSKNENKIYSQFISTPYNVDYENDSARANRVIIMRIKCDANGNIPGDVKNIKLKYAGRINSNSQNIGQLIDWIKAKNQTKIEEKIGLKWLMLNRYGEFIKNDSQYLASFGGENCVFLIGVDTTFMNTVRNNRCIIRFNGSHKDLTWWQRDMFIPYFYDLVKVGEMSLFDEVTKKYTDEEAFKMRIAENTYTIKQTDVVCFVPNLSSIKRPKDFQWKFVCKSTNDEITPKTYRSDNNDKSFPTILTPLFGRYDFATLPDPGYYDVILSYKLDDNQEENNTVTISSQLLVEK